MVPWAADLVAETLCNGVQGLLAQAAETAVGVQMSTCETLRDGQGGVALCARAICNSAFCVSRPDQSGCRCPTPIITIRRRLVDLRGNAWCARAPVVSVAGWTVAAAMSALTRRG